MTRSKKLKGVGKVNGGLSGLIRRFVWRRAGRKMVGADVESCRKRLSIVTGQLDGMPVSSALRKRRMELLIDREQCLTMLEVWESTQSMMGGATAEPHNGIS